MYKETHGAVEPAEVLDVERMLRRGLRMDSLLDETLLVVVHSSILVVDMARDLVDAVVHPSIHRKELGARRSSIPLTAVLEAGKDLPCMDSHQTGYRSYPFPPGQADDSLRDVQVFHTLHKQATIFDGEDNTLVAGNPSMELHHDLLGPCFFRSMESVSHDCVEFVACSQGV